ncbi:TIGR02680 family protein [Actinophytocola sp.]|uniref:TIGR02680 family protein n=1 Tax=Actinophytocola sp. TaxID=1872138 RepID=UPI002ED8E86B
MIGPTPHRARWQPLRAGLVDLFYYDAEEFHFHDGRLLLRGNNGTGKSKVLALTLPFLLDGELAAHRVEPDGDRNKRMEWNLLLGGKHPHPERLGYAWLEFGRLLADGTAEYRTIGAGLKAVSGRGIARHWFFVTSQRIGRDLSLLSPTQVALTREKLRDAVDGHGTVYDTASDYRRAVDEALFGLGTHRYEALVNLLIQLRQPQLSKKPDERLLSRALTEALPPLDPALVTTVAEAFRGLDEEREALRGLAEAKSAADAFLTHYRRYAGIAAKRCATPVRQAHSRYEQLGRELGDAETAHGAAHEALEAAEEQLEELAAVKIALEARRTALQQSPEMRDAEALKTAGQDADRLGKFAVGREADRRSAQETAGRREAQLVQARADAEAEGVAFRAAKVAAADAAAAALLAAGHEAMLAELDAEAPPFAGASRTGDALIERQVSALSRLEVLLGKARAADTALRAARADVDRITGEQHAAADRIASAGEFVTDRAAALLAAYTRYVTGADHVRVAEPEDVLAALDAWTETPTGPNPAASAVDDAARKATAELSRQQAEVDARRAEAEREHAATEEEISRLREGGHDVPPQPYTRDERTRNGRAGAPLWKVVDFTAGVPDDHRAGIEAALEAAGILDAWVTPDGELRDAVRDDVIVGSGDPVPGGGLTAVLAPAVDRDDPLAAVLTDDAVGSVLASIGLGPGSSTWVGAWIDVDGRFVNGPLTGSWHKPVASYIGEGAREAARRARLAQLEEELAGIGNRLAGLAEIAAGLADRAEALVAEQRARPSDAELLEAHVKLAGEHETKRRVDTALAEAAAVTVEREKAAHAARAEVAEFAGDVGLPSDDQALAAVRGAVGDYRVALAGLWPAARAADRARRDVTQAEQELTSAAEALAQNIIAADRAREEAEAAAERHRVLVETAGAGVDELYRKLAAVDTELNTRDEHERNARKAADRARDERGKAEGRKETLRESIDLAAAERDHAVGALRAFVATGLLHTVLPDVAVPDPATDWAPTPAVAAARAVNAALDPVDDADRPWELVQQRVSAEHKLLTDALSRHGHSVGMTVRDGIIVVDVLFQGRNRDIPTLVAGLDVETEHRATLLSAKEREILENHLVNEVAGTLQELITGAESQVTAINADLADRPTSTGMRLRLQWRTARTAPEGLSRVRDRLLRQTADAWSAEDRAAVGAFLQEQINREHAEDTSSGWVEQLTRALDYRGWHEFTIQRYQDGQWRPATGPASGGERVLAASVPLFAAASSFYTSAGNPHAPRLIALDEAFAGVDDDSRAKCLGLLAAFDLDVVMTSEREWGCYPQVPGLAIAQLTRRDGIDAVLVTPWRWDGRERLRLDRPASYLPATPTDDLADALFE